MSAPANAKHTPTQRPCYFVEGEGQVCAACFPSASEWFRTQAEYTAAPLFMCDDEDPITCDHCGTVIQCCADANPHHAAEVTRDR